MGSRSVLLIEDDLVIARLLSLHLQELGCMVECHSDGRSGLDAALGHGPWNLIVLDLGLPGMDGLEICRQLRNHPAYSPILMLTARAGVSNRVLGLELGADDYLTKPFSVVEFAARVKAILRRVEHLTLAQPQQQRLLKAADLFLDLDQRLARRAEVALDLTAREFDLLAHFVQHPARVFSRAELLNQVWGMTHEAFEHTVSSHINRLRAKLELDPAKPRYIVTVWGVGYRLSASPQLRNA